MKRLIVGGGNHGEYRAYGGRCWGRRREEEECILSGRCLTACLCLCCLLTYRYYGETGRALLLLMSITADIYELITYMRIANASCYHSYQAATRALEAQAGGGGGGGH